MFSSKSSSFHTLNTDKRVYRRFRRLYYFLNKVNNNFPFFPVSYNLDMRIFKCDYASSWNRFSAKDSPSRKLSNLFWLNLPWEEIQSELGEIHIFDTGCGNGKYGIQIQDWSHNRITKYVGVDTKIREDWQTIKETHPYIHLLKGDASSVGIQIPRETNFFITQSSLEHIEQDVHYFRQVHEFIKAQRKSVLQVHLVPSAACLNLYGLHGVRQYTPRTIKRLFDIFKDDSYSVLYEMGGAVCNSLHLDFITTPIQRGIGDLRDTQTEQYDSLLLEAIAKDMRSSQGEPSFYALVIHSFWKEKLF